MTLMTGREVETVLAADERAQHLINSRTRTGPVRAVLYIPRDCTNVDKHVNVCIERAEKERYAVTGMAHTPRDVIALVQGHLVDVVLAAVRWRDGRFDEVEAASVTAGAHVTIVRAVPGPRRMTLNPVIARMAALGIPPEIIAEALAAPVDVVRQSLDLAREGPRRPRRRENRPAANHPWRTPAG